MQDKHPREEAALARKTERAMRRCLLEEGWRYGRRQNLPRVQKAPPVTKSPYRVSRCGAWFVTRPILQHEHSRDKRKRDTRTVPGIALFWALVVPRHYPFRQRGVFVDLRAARHIYSRYQGHGKGAGRGGHFCVLVFQTFRGGTRRSGPKCVQAYAHLTLFYFHHTHHRSTTDEGVSDRSA